MLVCTCQSDSLYMYVSLLTGSVAAESRWKTCKAKRVNALNTACGLFGTLATSSKFCGVQRHEPPGRS